MANDMDELGNLKRVIQEFYEDPRHDTGLAVLSPPTGSRKTSSMIDYIFDCYCKGAPYRWVFITPRRNNLPVDNMLKKKFDYYGMAEEFERDVMDLKKNSENICEFMSKVTHEDDSWFYQDKTGKYMIPGKVTEAKDKEGRKMFCSLWLKCFSRPDFKKVENAEERKALESSFYDEVRKLEQPLRRFIKTLLKNVFGNPEAIKNELFREGSEWAWVPKMYPAAKIERKKIIFMSVSKMFYPMDLIYQSDVFLFDSHLLDGMRVVMDEFDECKVNFLEQCIKDMLEKNPVDPIKLFKELCTLIDKTTIPQDLDFYGARDSKSANQILKAKAQKDFERYNLDMNYKTDMESLDSYDSRIWKENRIFMFSDDRHITLTTKKLWVKPDKAKGQNRIMFSARPESLPEEQELENILGASYGLSRYVANNIVYMARSFYRRQQAAGRRDFDESKAINSVLCTFGFSDTTNEYLKSLMNADFSQDVAGSDDLDLSIYKQGFSYNASYDDPNDEFRSGIRHRELRLLPETILLKMCSHAKVIGLSATGSMENPLGNFDLEYLRNMLMDRYYVLSPEQEAGIQRQLDVMNSHYDNVSIHPITIPPKGLGAYCNTWWEKIFRDKAEAQDAYDFVAARVKRSKNHFAEKRHFCIAYAYFLFVTLDIRSFLNILNKYPADDRDLNKDVLEEICLRIEHAYGDKDAKQSKTEVLRMEGFAARKDKILDMLQKGERVFVISVFPTTGTAQNMQYGIPDNQRGQLVKINDLVAGGEKDFDAIYIEKPSNMIPQIKKVMSEEDIVRAAVSYEYMYQAGDITFGEMIRHMRNAAKADWEKKEKGDDDEDDMSPDTMKLYGLPSVMSRTCAVYAQALGRIGRTNMKSRDIYVCTQEDMIKVLNPDVFKGIHISHELKAVLDSLEKDSRKKPADVRERNIAQKKSDKTHICILKLARGVWNDDTMTRWTGIRGFVKKNPTLTDEEYVHLTPFERRIVDNMYIRLPARGKRLAYSQKRDYESVEITFGDNPGGWQEVSQESARLAELMSAPDAKQAFAAEGDACEWADGDYIMTPSLFAQVYLGAIGETAVMAILSRFRIPLALLTDSNEFEKADFRVTGSSILVDVKHWKPSTQKDAEEVIGQICDKLKGLNCRAVYVINCLRAGSFTEIHETEREGLLIVEVPYLYNPATGEYNMKAIEHIGRKINELRTIDESDGV